MSKPPHILHISFRYDPDVNNLAYRLLDAFAPPEYASLPLYLLAPHQEGKGAQREGICLNAQKANLKGSRRTVLERAMREALEVHTNKQPFDCIIAHRMRGAILASRALASEYKTGIVVVHGRGTMRKRRRKTRVRKFLDDRWSFVAISNAVQTDLIEHGIDKDRIEIIPNALDVEAIRNAQLDREEARAALGIDEFDGRILGVVSRLVPGKGIHTLLDALSSDEFRESQLVILGDGPEREALEAQAGRLGIANRVTWMGHIPEAHKFMRAFDVFVHPSHEEGFGMVLLEAMAAKRPIVASNAGGIPEVLGDLGNTVPAGDMQALRNRLMLVLSQAPGAHAALGQALFDRLVEQFSLADAHKAMRAHVSRRLETTP